MMVAYDMVFDTRHVDIHLKKNIVVKGILNAIINAG